MKYFMYSLFLAFSLAKLTDFTGKSGDSSTELGKGLYEIQDYVNNSGLGTLKAFEIFDLGVNFNGTTHTLNYLFTYTPIFLLGFICIRILLSVIHNKKKQVKLEKSKQKR